jgi:hypothetical protein
MLCFTRVSLPDVDRRLIVVPVNNHGDSNEMFQHNARLHLSEPKSSNARPVNFDSGVGVCCFPPPAAAVAAVSS